MKLIHKKIPAQFLKAMPRGLKHVRKHGQEFLVVKKVTCPNGHDLMADTVRIHGEPSIRIHMKMGKTEGLVFVDAYWGGHEKLYNFIPDTSAGTLSKVTCPVCGTDMVVNEKCHEKKCGSGRAINFHLPGKQDRIIVCARLGCPGHRIEVSKLSLEVTDEVSEINFPPAQEEDILLEI